MPEKKSDSPREKERTMGMHPSPLVWEVESGIQAKWQRMLLMLWCQGPDMQGAAMFRQLDLR